MKIVCTVAEFGDIVRGCKETSDSNICRHCPLDAICDHALYIEQFVSACDITDGAEVEG